MLDIDEMPSSNRRRRSGGVKEKPGITTDMNSMVDMAFLLLTFFMLSTTMYRPRGMELVMPVPDDAQTRAQEVQAVKASQALTLMALPDDRLYYYRGLLEASAIRASNYNPDGIRAVLKTFVGETDKPVVLIKPHPDCTFQNLVTLLDEMNINRIGRYAIDGISQDELALLQQIGVRLPPQ